MTELDLSADIMLRLPRWDIFCRVIDNYGDIGVCWRLSRQLAAEHGVSVRLWVDSLSTFAILCPDIDPGQQIQQVGNIEVGLWSPDFPDFAPADVVIEAFACELPPRYVAAMSRRPVAPVWINMEYLSAEPWVTECHGLASPQSHAGLTKHFFFPGFVEGTGGLIREQGLLAARQSFTEDAAAEFWRSLQIPVSTQGECRVSMFCYDNPALPELLDEWSTGTTPVRVLAMPGPGTEQAACWLRRPLSPGTTLQRGALTIQALPFLTQDRYDTLLWACDFNFVRGEDSFVRAQWACRPFVWQIYPQAENTHLTKLEAFLSLYLDSFSDPPSVRDCWRAWNGVGRIDEGWRAFATDQQALESHAKQWASQLDRAQNLANNLVCFAHGVRSQA